ncbi:ASCH domain-containing protein [Candidatus Gracilibacteria bacterium]|nr:ASCH domain-containing protein [Candidatus Gracilibacteria bacterium]
MRTYLLNVQEPYKTFILNGQKIFEGRLNKGKFAEMQVGDILEFENTKEKFEIISKNIFANFSKMMENLGFEKVIPDAESIDDAVNNVYYKFYSPEDEKKFGVVAIEIKKI